MTNLTRGVRRSLLGRGAGYAVPPVLGIGPSVVPALSRASGRLWQDLAKTTPAVLDGDPVRVAVCPYTGTDFTATSAAARPVLVDEGSGRWTLLFDGVDDGMAGPDLLYAGNQPVGLGVRGVFEADPGGPTVVLSWNDTIGFANTTPLIYRIGTSYTGELGSASGAITAAGGAAPDDARVVFRYSGTQVKLRKDGSDAAPVAYSAAAIVGGPCQVGQLGNGATPGSGTGGSLFTAVRLAAAVPVLGDMSDAAAATLDAYLAALL